MWTPLVHYAHISLTCRNLTVECQRSHLQHATPQATTLPELASGLKMHPLCRCGKCSVAEGHSTGLFPVDESMMKYEYVVLKLHPSCGMEVFSSTMEE